MVAAFCLFEAGSVFQTFSPDKPDIFIPWTTIVDMPINLGNSSTETEKGGPRRLCTCNVVLHGTEGGVCSQHEENNLDG